MLLNSTAITLTKQTQNSEPKQAHLVCLRETMSFLSLDFVFLFFYFFLGEESFFPPPVCRPPMNLFIFLF